MSTNSTFLKSGKFNQFVDHDHDDVMRSTFGNERYYNYNIMQHIKIFKEDVNEINYNNDEKFDFDLLRRFYLVNYSGFDRNARSTQLMQEYKESLGF